MSEETSANLSGAALLHNLILFGRVCRGVGLQVTPQRIAEASTALSIVRLADRRDVYFSLRALLVRHLREIELFDQAFRVFWQRPSEGWSRLDLRSLGETRQKKRTRLLPAQGLEEGADRRTGHPGDESDTAFIPLYSGQESLRRKDFAEMNREEREQARRLMERLDLSPALRRTRRYELGKGRSVNLRRLLREAMKRRGDLIRLPRRRSKRKPRRIVLICDISGSMESYTRILLHFMHALGSGRWPIESFVFATRLTRITLPLRRKSVDQALREVGASVQDWGGGTRIGEALQRFNYIWSRRVLGWGALVLLITDGWDRGEPDLLRGEVERLRRSCHRLIWLNPLLGRPGYEPLTRGAQAILPGADEFLPVHNLASLEALGRSLSRVEWKG